MSGINNIDVSRCGNECNLCGIQAKLWLAGRFNVAFVKNTANQSELQKLESMGLVEITEPDDTADYRLLTNCVICSVNPVLPYYPLNKNEKLIWKWIKNTEFKLTISELVYLMEQNIIPDPIFFAKNNWHTLIHTIYTGETIFDRILETKMEQSPARDGTVSAVLGLLRKKHIILL